MMSKFKHCTLGVKYKLFKSFCMSLYGCPLWDTSSKPMESFYVAWRKCIRSLFHLPKRTHCDILPGICMDIPVDIAVDKRICKFIHGLLASSNKCIATGAEMCVSGSNSIICNNVMRICYKYGLTVNDLKEMPLSCI